MKGWLPSLAHFMSRPIRYQRHPLQDEPGLRSTGDEEELV